MAAKIPLMKTRARLLLALSPLLLLCLLLFQAITQNPTSGGFSKPKESTSQAGRKPFAADRLLGGLKIICIPLIIRVVGRKGFEPLMA